MTTDDSQIGVRGSIREPFESSARKRRRLMKPDGVHIGSISTFMREIEQLEDEPDFQYFFRGHGDHSWECEPAIYRKQGHIENEHILFKEMILRCPADFNESGSTFEMLVKMQHYSLPTRLLDITTNALVALFFACGEDAPKEYGEVVVFRVPKSFIRYYDSDTISVVANVARRPADFALPAANLTRDEFNTDARIHHLIHDIRREKSYFEPGIVRNHLTMVHCVKPKLNNPRIIRQDGAFFLFGIDEVKLNAAQIPMEWFLPKARMGERLLITPQGKKKIRSQLAKLGISHSTLFPEVDSVAKHISELYGIKPSTTP